MLAAFAGLAGNSCIFQWRGRFAGESPLFPLNRKLAQGRCGLRKYIMALLPYLDSKDASPEVQKLLTGRPVVLNVQRMTANAQKIFVQRSRLSNALFTQTTIDPKLRELAILRTAKDCHSIYEWTQHVPAARHVGLSDQQINAIENWQNASCFSDVERLVLKFTEEVNANVKA